MPPLTMTGWRWWWWWGWRWRWWHPGYVCRKSFCPGGRFTIHSRSIWCDTGPYFTLGSTIGSSCTHTAGFICGQIASWLLLHSSIARLLALCDHRKCMGPAALLFSLMEENRKASMEEGEHVPSSPGQLLQHACSFYSLLYILLFHQAQSKSPLKNRESSEKNDL